MAAPTHRDVFKQHEVVAKADGDDKVTVTVNRPGGEEQHFHGIDIAPLLKGGLSAHQALAYVVQLMGNGIDAAASGNAGIEIPAFRFQTK